MCPYVVNYLGPFKAHLFVLYGYMDNLGSLASRPLRRVHVETVSFGPSAECCSIR